MATHSRKRAAVQEYESLSDIDEPTQQGKKAKLHGVLTNLSPWKGRFFDGKISDGEDTMRLVGFSETKRNNLAEYLTAKTPLQFSNCAIQTPFAGEGRFEIIVRDNTTIGKSHHRFNTDDFQIEESQSADIEELTLNKLSKTTPFQRISTKVKCVEILDTLVLDETRHVQNILLADQTATTRMALWETNIGSLAPGKTYHLQNVQVKHFGEQYTLTSPRHGMLVTEIKDFPGITCASLATHTDQTTLHKATVIAVSGLSQHQSCIVCKKGHISPVSDQPSLGKCSDCPTTTLMSKCIVQTSAMLTIEANQRQYELAATGEQLAEIAGIAADEITDLALLVSEPFDLQLEHMKIVKITPTNKL